jgi:hypothetical protein
MHFQCIAHQNDNKPKKGEERQPKSMSHQNQHEHLQQLEPDASTLTLPLIHLKWPENATQKATNLDNLPHERKKKVHKHEAMTPNK